MSKDYTREEVLGIVNKAAESKGIPKDDFMRFAYIETGGRFDEQASRGPNGAKGLFQFVPKTAEQYGIAGRELDAVANTDAAARLYLDNQKAIVSSHNKTGAHYLSGEAKPTGLDMYMAHQQGVGGYASMQNAIANGSFGRSDTRANILNNVSSKDMQSITGMTKDQFSHLSDSEMAKTFVKYWDTKFDRISIPEVGIKPKTGAQEQPSSKVIPDQAAPTAKATAISLSSAYDLSVKYDDTRYGLGKKDPASGKVDCSGWVVKLQNATMDEINQKTGKPIFTDKDKFSPGYDAAATIIQKSVERSGVLIEGPPITKSMLKEGMIIGEDNGKTSFDAGRYKGIDHIVQVVRDPKTNELMISQSRGGEGVELTSVDKYLKYKQDHGVKQFLTDPLAKARPLLEGNQQSLDNSQTSTKPVVSGTKPGVMADGMMKLGEKGPEIALQQTLLNRLGYTGENGKPLKTDGEFGPNTLAAVKQFQHDHDIKDSGIVGPKTLAALAAADKQLLTNPNNPNNELFKQVLGKVNEAEAQRKIPSGDHSEKLAAALTVEALREGITKVDRVELNNTGTSARAVQVSATRDESALNRNTDSICVPQAMKQPVRESSEQAVQVATNVQAQQQDQQRSQTQPQAASR